MKQVVINIPDKCHDCGFRKYVYGYNNNGPDDPDVIECVIMDNREIAMDCGLTVREAHFDKITQKVYPEVCKNAMVMENETKEWDGKAPDWCPGKEQNIPNAITLKNDIMDKY
jgi:hypothetical protein